MARLFALLPAAKRGAHAADSAALAPLVLAALRPGDAVLVKGALGSRMARDRPGADRTWGRVIFNLFAPYAEEFALFNLVRYTHLPRRRRLPDRAGAVAGARARR